MAWPGNTIRECGVRKVNIPDGYVIPTILSRLVDSVVNPIPTENGMWRPLRCGIKTPRRGSQGDCRKQVGHSLAAFRGRMV
jgi:hypothetical protein